MEPPLGGGGLSFSVKSDGIKAENVSAGGLWEVITTSEEEKTQISVKIIQIYILGEKRSNEFIMNAPNLKGTVINYSCWGLLF